MIKRKLIAFAVAALLLPGVLVAKELNMAFVDGQQIVQKYQGEIDKRLGKEFEARRTNILALQDELKEKTEKLTRDEAILSEAEVKKIQQSVAVKQRELQRLSAAYQEDYNLRGNQELQNLGEKIQNVIDDVAKEKNFDIVMQRGAAIFVDKNFDITKEVLNRLDKAQIG